MTKIYTVERITVVQVVAENDLEATKKGEELMDMCGEGDTYTETTLKGEVKPFDTFKHIGPYFRP